MKKIFILIAFIFSFINCFSQTDKTIMQEVRRYPPYAASQYFRITNNGAGSGRVSLLDLRNWIDSLDLDSTLTPGFNLLGSSYTGKFNRTFTPDTTINLTHLSTQGYVNRAISASGVSAIPLNLTPIGTGTGLTSSPNYFYDPSTGEFWVQDGSFNGIFVFNPITGTCNTVSYGTMITSGSPQFIASSPSVLLGGFVRSDGSTAVGFVGFDGGVATLRENNVDISANTPSTGYVNISATDNITSLAPVINLNADEGTHSGTINLNANTSGVNGKINATADSIIKLQAPIIQFVKGVPGVNKVWTDSTGTGIGTWKTASGGGGGQFVNLSNDSTAYINLALTGGDATDSIQFGYYQNSTIDFNGHTGCKLVNCSVINSAITFNADNVVVHDENLSDSCVVEYSDTSFGNTMKHTVIKNVGDGCAYQNNTIDNVVIDVNSQTGFTYTNNVQKGLNGLGTPNSAEIYLNGDTISINNNNINLGYIDGISRQSSISGNILNRATIDFLGFNVALSLEDNVLEEISGFEFNNSLAASPACIIRNNTFSPGSFIDFYTNSVAFDIHRNNFGQNSYCVIANNDIQSTNVGIDVTIDNTNGAIDHVDVCNGTTWNPDRDYSNISYCADSTYNTSVATGLKPQTLPLYVDSAGKIFNQLQVGIKEYKALISQNAPTSGVYGAGWAYSPPPAGMVMTLTSYSFGDNFDDIVDHTISGTPNTDGWVFVANGATPSTWTVSTMTYDGAPYVVSTVPIGTYPEGIYHPFVNTLGGDPAYEYDGTGHYTVRLTGLFPQNKTSFQISSVFTFNNNPPFAFVNNIVGDDSADIFVADSESGTDDNELNKTPFNITVYP